jgi:hypothetical protein
MRKANIRLDSFVAGTPITAVTARSNFLGFSNNEGPLRCRKLAPMQILGEHEVN